ncbi:MAG: zf-TFIIB domain-containing protein [Ignavibacteriales bacterium]
MNCPKCNSTLEPAEVENIKIEVCPSCDGIWLDKFEITKILHCDFDSIKTSEISKALEKDKDVSNSKTESIKCPVCSLPMTNTNYLFNDNIKIDMCSECYGIWLDDGELKEIINYAKNKSGSLSDEEISKLKINLQESKEALKKSGIAGLLESYLISVKRIIFHKDYDLF